MNTKIRRYLGVGLLFVASVGGGLVGLARQVAKLDADGIAAASQANANSADDGLVRVGRPRTDRRAGSTLLTTRLASVTSLDGRLVEVDPLPLERVQIIALKGPVGGMDHLALDVKRRRLFVANTVNDSLDVVDLKAGKLLKQVPGQGRIRGIAFSPEVDRVFVGNGTRGVCNTFDGEGYELIKSVALGDDADNVRYNPQTGRIYVVHADTELSVIDAKDFSLRRPIALPKSLGAFQLEAGRPRMYVNAKAEGRVVVIDTDKDEVVSQFPVEPAGVNAALAIDEPNRRLFVGCRKNPSLVVMNSDTGKVVARLALPGDVDDVSFDARRKLIYASCGDGAIAVLRQIDPDRYESLAAVSTVKGARTSIYNAEDGRLYLAVPRRAERPEQHHPEVWIYEVRL
jgi:DNA-binding beta-propeller fold protein YncE